MASPINILSSEVKNPFKVDSFPRKKANLAQCTALCHLISRAGSTSWLEADPEPTGPSSEGFYMAIHWVKSTRRMMEWNLDPVFLEWAKIF